jgi:elongation factor 3
MAVHGVIEGDRLAYAASIAAELCQSEDEVVVTGWVSALGPVLQEMLPDAPSLVRLCEKLKSGMGSATGGAAAAKKDPNTLAHCENLTLGYMGKILLLRARMHLEQGHRYGLVGENGAGKTTLMRKLALGELPGFPKDIKTMYVEPDFDEQSDILTPPAYLKAVWLEEGRAQDDAAIERVLKELMFTDKLKATPIGDLSGGWRMRVSLARATIVRADLLLLDEPTNHLDTAAVEWLMSFLRSIKTTAIVISHEPYFLDAIATDVIMIKRKKLQIFKGNFTTFTK